MEKEIRFVDSKGVYLFSVPDGGYIKTINTDNFEIDHECKYVSETHVFIDLNTYNIADFIDFLKQKSCDFRPVTNEEYRRIIKMNNREFAEQIYDFLLRNDEPGRFEGFAFDESIVEIENHLSDLSMVTETIKDIEEIADELDDHEVYVSEVKPILRGLREIQAKLETEQRRRMVGETSYEVKHAIHVGDKEIVFAEDIKAENGMCWFVGDYTQNEIIGQYADCQVSDDYLESIQEFTDRISRQIEAMKGEISQSKLLHAVFTAKHCYPNDYGQSIDGKIVAIKAEILRPEYRRGDVQLVLVNGGNGAKANPMGRAVYCYHLNDGKHTRFERHDVQGEVKPECLPQWAKEKAAAIQAEKATPPQKKPKDKEMR